MTPNIMKTQANTAKFADNKLPDSVMNAPSDSDSSQGTSQNASANASSSSYDQSGKMDGDHAAKTMDAAATSTAGATDFSEGLHETAKQGGAEGDKATGQGTSMFDADKGAIGRQFHAEGNIGQIGEKIGGPFASSGMVGKQFTTGGAVGGTLQQLAEKNQQH